MLAFNYEILARFCYCKYHTKNLQRSDKCFKAFRCSLSLIFNYRDQLLKSIFDLDEKARNGTKICVFSTEKFPLSHSISLSLYNTHNTHTHTHTHTPSLSLSLTHTDTHTASLSFSSFLSFCFV